MFILIIPTRPLTLSVSIPAEFYVDQEDNNMREKVNNI